MDTTLIKEIGVGLLGGAIASTLIFLINYLRELRLRIKYSLAGYYTSEFQDEANEYTISYLRLKQKGMKISGIDQHSDGRKWKLEGSIVGGSHVCGVYSATAFYDEGVGSFYLQVKEKTLEGIWTGFANRLKKIKSGRYILKQVSRSEWIEGKKQMMKKHRETL